MALIKCPECGADISDKAESCPKCGNPISSKSKVQLVELTQKKYKRHILCGCLTLIVGFILAIILAAVGYKDSPIIGFSFVILFVGIIWLTIGAVLAWWHHA